MKSQVFLSIGVNSGNRERTIAHTIERIPLGTRQQSSVYETQPWQMENAPWFLNCVVSGFTEIPPEELLHQIQQIEKKLGRLRSAKSAGAYKSRPIDIDILFYGNSALKTSALTIPHPLIAQRRFVLVPLVEIAPNFIHPILQKSMREMLKECADTSIVKKLVALQ